MKLFINEILTKNFKSPLIILMVIFITTASSSTVPQQPNFGQGLSQKLQPFVLFSCGTLPLSFTQLLGIPRHSIFPSLFRSALLPSSFYYCRKTLLAVFWSSSRMTCPAHIRLLILMYVIMSLSLQNVYISLLYSIFKSLLSFVGSKMALKSFLSKPPILASSDFDSTQVSESYTSTGLISVLYNVILFFMDKNL